jgi:hypothetical protein
MRRRTESVQEKASEELLLTGQQQWAKTEGNPRTDARICTPPPPPPPTTGRRDEKGAAGGSGAKAAAASRGGSRPAPAKRGRDRHRHRHWHWRAASCRAVLVLEFLEACAGAAVRARRGGGWQVDRSHLPTVGRPLSLSPAAPHRTCFVYKFSRPRPLIFTSSAILPAVAGSAGRGPEWQTWGSDGEGRPTELLLLPVRGSACQCCQVSQLWLSSRHVGSASVKVK